MPLPFNRSLLTAPVRALEERGLPRNVVYAAILLALAFPVGYLLDFLPKMLPQSEEGPAHLKGELLWWLDDDEVPSGSYTPVAWPAGDVLAVATERKVAGYGAVDGRRHWELPLPGAVCATSPEIEDGRVAVLHGGGENECDRVQLIDVRAGKAVWQRALPRWDQRGSRYTQVVIADGAVAVQRDEEGITAFRLRDGKLAWRRVGLQQGCLYSAIGGGPQLVAEQECGGGAYSEVQMLRVADGHARWTHRLGKGEIVQAFLSSDPPIVGIGESDLRDIEKILAFTTAGAPGADLKLAHNTDVRCRVGEISQCQGIVIDGTTVYLGIPSSRERFAPLVVAAYDMTSGRKLWSHRYWEAERVPVGLHDGRLITAHPAVAAQERGYHNDPNGVTAMDPRNGDMSELLWIPTSMTGIDEMIHYNGSLYWMDGRFVLLRHTSLLGGDKLPALAVFGRPPAGTS